MIQLDPTKEEKDLLAGILENDLSDLRTEIGDTDNMDFRKTLKNQKAVLQKVLETLRQAK